MRRTNRLAALSALAVAAAGCASVSGASPDTGHSATVASRNGGSHGGSSAGPSAKPKSTAPSRTQRAQRSPFSGIASYVASTHYYITAAVYDRKTGRTFVFHANPGAPMRTASIVKVEIMGALFRQHEVNGQPVSSADQSLLMTMIENSDNASATSLWNEDGGAAGIQSFDDSIGMTGTVASTDEWIPGSTNLPGWGWTSTTALDQVRIVRDFAYPNKWIDNRYRQQGLTLMEHVEADQAWGVSSGVPSGVTIALKNGWLPLDLSNYTDWQVNSVGWIKGNGRDYVLAVLCQGSTSEGAGISAIDTIAGHVYAALGNT
jgi:beta-lactamase class A